MSILLSSTLDVVRKEFALKPPTWSTGHTLTKTEDAYLRKECTTESEFDPHNRRRTMYQNMMNGAATVVKKVCPYGTVIAILEHPEQYEDIPWELWARILRMYTDEGHPPFVVYLLANTHLRTFPSGRQPITANNMNGRHPITPNNINGGYTYPCNRQSIIIYRAEDATRVLLHELMHSCCLDDPALDIDRVEAATEAWAELMYVALLSQGKGREFSTLLHIQSIWMIKQDEIVRKHMQDPNSMEFPWRYTIGKEELWRKWNILRELPLVRVSVGNSLRLTCPPSAALKSRFHVRQESTIL
jgi:hypothetical protein